MNNTNTNTLNRLWYKEPTVDSETSAIAPYIIKDFLKKRIDGNIETYNEQLELHVTKEDIKKVSKDWDLTVFEIKNNITVMRSPDLIIIRNHYRDNYSEIDIMGSFEKVKIARDYFKDNFKEKSPTIRWVYDSRGDSVKCGLNTTQLPVIEMYPFLNAPSLENYYDRFMNSSSNIIILIGPPGTGKTSFIRGLMHHSNSDAVVSYDPGVLQSDSLFANFISNDDEYSWFDDAPTRGESLLVLEDADLLLSSRSDGNTIMHRFLNISDGIVSSPEKKLIFTTNLPSISDIDSALVRPGRCFDVINFRPLNYDELVRLNKVFNLQKTFSEHDSMDISEYFN